MSWHLAGPGHILLHMHETGTIKFIRLHVQTETLTGANSRWVISTESALSLFIRLHVYTENFDRTISCWVISTASMDSLALMGPGHLQVQWWPNSNAWINEYTVNMWVLKPWRNNIHLGDQLWVCGWPGTYRARKSTCTVKIKFIYMKQELQLQCLSGYMCILQYRQNNIQFCDQHCGCGWPCTCEARTYTGTVKIKLVCMK